MFPSAPQTTPLALIFGVRHLSPAAGCHLALVLDQLRPTAVLVEGPSDATDLIPHLVHKDTKPPVAVLAYTKTRPVRSIVYPLANYSPEWVALTWGLHHKAETRFIDLPASVFLELHRLPETEAKSEHGPEPVKDSQDIDPTPKPTSRKVSEQTLAYLDDPYEAIAQLAGDPDHETWWERHFEHTIDPASYLGQSFALGQGIRELRRLQADDENLIREAYMRRSIKEVLARGHRPDKVLIVCGAFHAPALVHELEPMKDRALKELPRIDTSLTLMPYSYYRLSAQSGYGAGCHAPGYFQRLYEEKLARRPDRLGMRFLAELAGVMRKAGQLRSAAEVIEAVRLAHSLAALSGSSAPCLRDLRHAAVTCLGRGEESQVQNYLVEVEIGPTVGRLPKGVGRTAIQDDFHLQLESLGLDGYLSEQARELVLDLRENRRVKSVEAAFRDRNRSTFLHRLGLLEIAFARLTRTGQSDVSVTAEVATNDGKGTAREVWMLKWSPECEIRLVEAAFHGDTIDMAVSTILTEKLQACTHVDEAATVVRQAFDCELSDALEAARLRVQAMAVEDSSFVALARAVNNLAEIIAYRDVRRFDPAPLKPLLAQLFLRATLFVQQACLCDRQSANEVHQAMVLLNRVAQERHDLVNGDRWYRELDEIAAADHLNPYLSGYAGGVIIEIGRLDELSLAALVSRRLSPGLEAERGAVWFEGLSQHNRQALFSRVLLWDELDKYVLSLAGDEFKRALVYLRRAFSDFAPGEIRRVVSLLVEISPEKADELKSSADNKLSDTEAQQLQQQLGDLGLDSW